MIAAHALLLLPVLLTPGPAAALPPAARVVVAQSPSAITGVVNDSSGGVVPGAVVLVRTASGAQRQTVTLNDGTFSITPPTNGEVTLIVEVSGFAPVRETLAPSAPRQNLRLVIRPAGLSDAVTVTPTRSEERMGDVPASVSVVNRDDIRRAPAVVADDILRQLPAFSLFRRSSSISAHPTSQGVSLRGIAPSGVSRTLVLVDGVPYNDAFGGWVYWTGLPIEGAQRIEVVDGASSSLYGNYAMGGVINVVTAPAARRTVDVRTQYGNRHSPKFDFHATDVWKRVGVSVDGSIFDTDGYANVPVTNPDGTTAGARGPIDNNVTVNFKNIGVKLDYAASDRVHAFLRTGYFREDRDNGKISTFDPVAEEANRTRWNYTSGGVRMRLADSSEIQATMFSDVKTFNANFLAVPNPTTRAIGRFSLLQ